MDIKKNIKIMGIIGIRSGSTGVKNKNIRNLLGKPLVGWILERAKQSNYLDRVIVSTDSREYAQIVREYGAEVPCLRPDSISGDNSPEFDYVTHMLSFLKKEENYAPDIVVRMMATVPLQSSEDIDAAIEILISDNEADSVVVIAEARQHPLKALKIIKDEYGKDKLVTYFSESGREVTPIARQNYHKAYFRSNIIVSKLKTIYESNSLTGDIVRYYKIPQSRAIDIDNEIDFEIAELLISKYQ